jgi:hypothetical protein
MYQQRVQTVACTARGGFLASAVARSLAASRWWASGAAGRCRPRTPPRRGTGLSFATSFLRCRRCAAKSPCQTIRALPSAGRNVPSPGSGTTDRRPRRHLFAALLLIDDCLVQPSAKIDRQHRLTSAGRRPSPATLRWSSSNSAPPPRAFAGRPPAADTAPTPAASSCRSARMLAL